jgi:hypothetical protein
MQESRNRMASGPRVSDSQAAVWPDALEEDVGPRPGPASVESVFEPKTNRSTWSGWMTASPI